MAYSEKVLDHYENPRNVGTFDPKKDNIGTGMVGAPACGDVMRLQIEVEEGIIIIWGDEMVDMHVCLTCGNSSQSIYRGGSNPSPRAN